MLYPIEGFVMKILLAILLALATTLALVMVLPATPAQTHEACIGLANTPGVSGGKMTYSGEYGCSVVHSSVTLKLFLERRMPGGSWTQIASNTDTDTLTNRNFTGVFTSIAFDCRKDYRTKATGTASPGGHSGPSNTKTKTHTC